jgi:hypothetical protein
MLKVLINEEEVLTNKDFTIKKEMLNTPSVILNNVYPKTWEDEKDYTSNFYHPQDYSKCKIIDETYYPEDPGITTIINGAATLPNVDTTKEYELTELDGNTTQVSTPTPSSPQPINVVSGLQEVDIRGVNAFDITKITPNKAIVGNTGVISNSTVSNLSDYTEVVPNTTYKLTYEYTTLANTNNRDYSYFDENKEFISGAGYKTISKSNNFTIPNNAKYIRFAYDKNCTDIYFAEVQSYEINLGKNLVNALDTSSMINFTKTDDVFTTSALTSSGYGGIASMTFTNSTPIMKNGVGYFSADIRLVSGTTSSINVIGDKALTRTNAGWVSNHTLSNEFQRYCYKYDVSIGTSFTGFMIQLYNCNNAILEIKNIMFSYSNDLDYSPYKTPIELCKIGTYQDRIYKSNGTWYLEKNIGKVVLNGSENWSKNGNVESGYLISHNSSSPFYNKVGNYGGYSNYFVVENSYTTWTGLGKCGFNSSFVFWLLHTDTSLNTLQLFKNWLSTHNTIVYYVLATPTTTEITDTELISQLNAIELLEGLNNISITSANLPGIMTIHYNYTEEQTIDDLLFCGVVKNSGNISLNPREPHYLSIQILDFKTFLSEGELDSFVIYQKTILEAIQMVIANIQDYGFILGNINILNPTDVIGAYSTKDKTAYDVFNYLADITQSRWTTRLIDENHVAIDFYDPALMTEGTPINYTQTFFEDNLIDDMTYSYGSNNYRNKQVMTSSQVYSNISQQQSIVANGYQTQFPTEQPIGKINSITSNGIPLTFATFNEKEMGYVADFYYSPGDNYFESEDLRTTGEILIIDYVAIVEGRQIITNPLEIDRINDSTGRKGIISRYEQRNDATTSTELQKIGESYIKYKGTPEIKLKISTRSNIWEVGQRVQFNAPIEELDTEYMVRTKKINYISTIDTIFYEYELISSFNSETEINFFDNQRAKTTGNIGEGEYISRNIDIESTAEIIFYETTTTEVVPSGDNELNAILNSPFIS